MDKVVEVIDVSMNYHTLEGETEAIRKLNFDIMNGEFVSIVGPSGCGKSTLLSLISGILTPTSGKVLINGKKVEGPSASVGYMLQKDHLFEWRNIMKNITIGLEIQGKLNKENQEFVEQLLKEYGLYEFRNHYPRQLSGGMRQRVALIRTLATKPNILLLDEPFSALDYQTKIAISEEVWLILKKEKKTAILVTHDLAEAISMSDRIIVLTKRPAEIKSMHQINLSCDCKTPITCREAPEFRIYFNKIWKELDVHV
ncbi:ABC transporter ATP-binding protein [Lutispora thermophila]|uniref:NitT/TauT family transport system ATP-binding protein n=1 Tax=Lutispora thermophila DSM 19022 TaxID=1122184 RepID=A0A1M6GL90_9FIRM|nr:ABC transporter ATP-binding protein [Lutispora thermophila]SHJ10690.1 NitT/TauT family transport system ATP-binding protein [Lutispora thermophila DSM 19022]